MPLLEEEVDATAAFLPEELLYRRVSSSELTEGELDPSRLNSVSFSKDVEGAPSVLRGRFSTPSDAMHIDCCNGKDKSDCLVYYLAVADIPGPLESGDGKSFAFFPIQKPLARCGAHSVLASYYEGDPDRAYVSPSRKVRNNLRARLATTMLPITQTFDLATRKPIGR